MSASLQRSVSVDSAGDAVSSVQKRPSQTRTHSYIPFIPRRQSMVIRDRVAGVSEINKDCVHIYPYLREDGTMVVVSEYDFNVKMQKKYKALLGDKYVYPVMDSAPKVTEEELLEVTRDDKELLDYFIPHEVEVMVPGGIRTFKKDAANTLLMLSNKDSRIYEVKVKSVTCKEMKEFESQRQALADSSQFCVPTNTGDINADDVIIHFIAGMQVPTVRRLRNVFGFCESKDEILDKLRQMGLLEKYEDKIDDEAYFKTFVNNRSRIFDAHCDYRRLKEEELAYSFDLSDTSAKAEVDDKPSDTSFESEVDIEPFQLNGKSSVGTAASCDSGLGLETPPLSPSSNSKSPTPCK
ncbi:hypothetical protein BIW11_01749 [Tropilaelaps mercedesae]|uniref:Uncharacterized protein n=1 Tax=Tropilaelaps mercedesae TaxID=418985 RepID=A0A1V9X9I8_9ACAR|nr:hypothetical protein BIW11_01749 [Tropilaelaps mercedesae]